MRAKNRSDKKLAIWIITVVLSVVLLFCGNRFFSKNLIIMDHPETSAKAKVTELGELVEESLDGIDFSARTQYFTAKILSGENKGRTVEAHQQIDSYLDTGERFVKVGDKVILLDYGAVNASNLDGGSSSKMIYEGEALNENASVIGSRGLPTSFLVRR